MKSFLNMISLFFVCLFVSITVNCSLPTESYFATYKLVYNGNGNTAGFTPVSANEYKYGDEIQIQDNVGDLLKNGAAFLNWNTESDNSGISYSANDTMHILSKDVVLYANYADGTTPPLASVSFSGPQFSLSWDAAETNTGSYTIYYRAHGTTGWSALSEKPTVPSLTINISTSGLAYGQYDFAVTYTIAGSTETEMHTSLDTTAFPATGWYLIWTE